jgi:two-component system sensor histidine kinase DesK
LLSVSIALTLGDRSGWGFLFTYCAACTALLSSANFSFAGVLACSALAGVMTWLGGGGGGAAIGYATSALGIGLLMLVLRDLRQRNEELSAARAELAQLAVARERERFARDLHDLLGHSLSVIALKAELAGRLVRERPDDADREIAELEQVARTALGEVREAVSGYRQPTLDDELAGARMALAAAGIEPEVNRASLALAPEAEAVLAWAVREGATNVIRHSRATHCTITIRSDGRRAWVEIVDDGTAAEAGASVSLRSPSGAGAGGGEPASTGAGGGAEAPGAREAGAGISPSHAGGHGLAGLAERAQAAGGELEAASQTEAGFRLAVAVPAG